MKIRLANSSTSPKDELYQLHVEACLLILVIQLSIIRISITSLFLFIDSIGFKGLVIFKVYLCDSQKNDSLDNEEFYDAIFIVSHK